MQKGFASVLILVGILVITAIAAGAFYYVSHKLVYMGNDVKVVTPVITSETPKPSSTSSVSSAPAGAGETANWKTYTNKKYQLEMKYPPDWLPGKNTSQSFKEGNDLVYIYKLGVNYRESTPQSNAVSLAIGIPVKTEENLNEWILNYYPKVNPVSNYQNQFSEENIGRRTFQKVYGCSQGCFTYYHIRNNDYIYRIEVQNYFVGQEQTTYQELINQILSTLKFTD